MSRRMVAVLAVILAVLCGAAAFVWLHAGGQSKTVVHFTPDPPANAHASSASAAASAGKNPSTPRMDSKSSANAAPQPGFMPVTGEVLEFTASVAKVSNVASLRLLVNGRKQIAGKDAWHLQAFAHTQNPLRMVFELDDQFDSYSVPGDFASVQYEMHLSERGQKVQSVERLTATGREPAPAGVSTCGRSIGQQLLWCMDRCTTGENSMKYAHGKPARRKCRYRREIFRLRQSK